MKYAVIRTGGKQYKVSEGDVIEVDNLDCKKDEKVIFDDVLLLVTDSGVKIGKPVLTDKVEGVCLGCKKGDKLYVSKYKAKVRYRRRVGFRASLTEIRIDKIGDKKEKVEEIKPKTAQKKQNKTK